MDPPDAHLPLVNDAGMEMPNMDSSVPAPEEDAASTPEPDRGLLPPETDRLAVERITPQSGSTDRNTDVVINGRGFPRDSDVFVEINETRLLEVDVLSASTITAIAPAGMPVGTHDLRLTLGDGRVAILPSAYTCLLYTSPSPRDGLLSRMPSSA